MSVFDYDDLTYYRTQYEKLMSERDRLRAQVEEWRAAAEKNLTHHADVAHKLREARATIAEQARRIEVLHASTITTENHEECCDERARQAEAPLKQALRDGAKHCCYGGCEVETRDVPGTTGCSIADAALKEQAAPGEGVERG